MAKVAMATHRSEQHGPAAIEGDGFVVLRQGEDRLVRQLEGMDEEARSFALRAVEVARAQPDGMSRAEGLLGIYRGTGSHFPSEFDRELLDESFGELKGQAEELFLDDPDEFTDRCRPLNTALIVGYSALGDPDRAIEVVDTLGGGELAFEVVDENESEAISIEVFRSRWPDKAAEDDDDLEAMVQFYKSLARCEAFVCIYRMTGDQEALNRAHLEFRSMTPEMKGADHGLNHARLEFAKAYWDRGDHDPMFEELEEIPREDPDRGAFVVEIINQVVERGDNDLLGRLIGTLPEGAQPNILIQVANLRNQLENRQEQEHEE